MIAIVAKPVATPAPAAATGMPAGDTEQDRRPAHELVCATCERRITHEEADKQRTDDQHAIAVRVARHSGKHEYRKRESEKTTRDITHENPCWWPVVPLVRATLAMVVLVATLLVATLGSAERAPTRGSMERLAMQVSMAVVERVRERVARMATACAMDLLRRP